MPGPVTDANRVTYRENVRLALQEMNAIYDNTFEFDSQLAGEQAQVIDIIGASEARRNAPEGGDTPNIGATHEPVWCAPERNDWGKLIERGDAVRALTDFKSSYVQGGAKAMVRGKNAILAGAVFANRRIGKQGVTSSAWAGSTVPIDTDQSGTPTSMTVAKILRAYRYLEEAEVNVEEEEIFLGLDPEENEQLYNDLTFVSKEYRDQAVVEKKRVKSILGLTIVPGKRFSVFDPSAEISVAPLWVKRGMVWGQFMPLKVDSAPNPNKQYREHPYMEEYLGATRVEDALVVKILNKKVA